MAKESQDLFQIALVGGETLLGGELSRVFEAQLKTAFVSGYASSGEGSFGQNDGEAVYLDPLDAQAVESSSVIVAAGSAAGSLKAYSLAKELDGKSPLIDCAGYLEQEPEALVVAPVPGEPNPSGRWLFVTAQPAAAAIVLVLGRLSRWRPVVRSVVNVFEPASERGKSGAEELHRQTSGILAFRDLEQNVFGRQLAFNLLSEYGPDSQIKLQAVERRIERHVEILLGSATPKPSIRVVQAPVFHVYTLSFWIEFAADITANDLGQALASAQIEVREAGGEAPDSINAAGQSGLLAGDIRVDRNNPRAAWLWIACDNLRLTADIAVTLIRAIQSKNS